MYKESLENKHHFMNILKEADIHKREIERDLQPKDAADYKRICDLRAAAFVELIKSGVQYINLDDRLRIVIDDENYDLSKDTLRSFIGDNNYKLLSEETANNVVSEEEVGIMTHTNERILGQNLLSQGYQNPFSAFSFPPTADPYKIAQKNGADQIPSAVNAYINQQQMESDKRLEEMEKLLNEYKKREMEAIKAAEIANEEKESLSQELKRVEINEKHARQLKEESDRALRETDEKRIQIEIENERIKRENEKLSREKKIAESKVSYVNQELSKVEQEKNEIEKKLARAYQQTSKTETKLKETVDKENAIKEAFNLTTQKEHEAEEKTSHLMEESMSIKTRLDEAIKKQNEAHANYQAVFQKYNKAKAENDKKRSENNGVTVETEAEEKRLYEQVESALLTEREMQKDIDFIRENKIKIEQALSKALIEGAEVQKKLSDISEESRRLSAERAMVEREKERAAADISTLKQEKEKILLEKNNISEKLADARKQLERQTKEYEGSMDKIVKQKQQAESQLKKEQLYRQQAEEDVKKISKKNKQLQEEKDVLGRMYGELSKKEEVAKNKAAVAIKEKEEVESENKQIREKLDKLLLEKDAIKSKMEAALKEAAEASSHVEEARKKVKQATIEKEAAIVEREKLERERDQAAKKAEQMSTAKELAENNLKKAENDRQEAQLLLAEARNKEKRANELRQEADKRWKEAEAERKSTLRRLTELEKEQTATEQELENARAQKLSAQQWAQEASLMAKKAQEERDAADAELRKAEARIRETESIENHMRLETAHAVINLDEAKKEEEKSAQKVIDASYREQEASINKTNADEIQEIAEKANKEALDEAARLCYEKNKVDDEIKLTESGMDAADVLIKKEDLGYSTSAYKKGMDLFDMDYNSESRANGNIVALTVYSDKNGVYYTNNGKCRNATKICEILMEKIHSVLPDWDLYFVSDNVIYILVKNGDFKTIKNELLKIEESMSDIQIKIAYGIAGFKMVKKQRSVSKADRFMNNIVKHLLEDEEKQKNQLNDEKTDDSIIFETVQSGKSTDKNNEVVIADESFGEKNNITKNIDSIENPEKQDFLNNTVSSSVQQDGRSVALNVTAPNISINIIKSDDSDKNVNEQVYENKSELNKNKKDLEVSNFQIEDTVSEAEDVTNIEDIIDSSIEKDDSTEGATESDGFDEREKKIHTDIITQNNRAMNDSEAISEIDLTRDVPAGEELLPEEQLMNVNSNIQISFEKIPLLENENSNNEAGDDNNLYNSLIENKYHSETFESADLYKDESDVDYEDIISNEEEMSRDTENDYENIMQENLGNRKQSIQENILYKIHKQNIMLFGTDIAITGAGVDDSFDISIMSYKRFGVINFMSWMNGYHGQEEEPFLENYISLGKTQQWQTEKYGITTNAYIGNDNLCHATIDTSGNVTCSVSDPYISGADGDGCIHIKGNGTDLFIFPLAMPSPDYLMDDGAEYIASIYIGNENTIVTGVDGVLKIGENNYKIYWDHDNFCCSVNPK